jgi:ABC-type glycerol-3-phosphate transport system permease component
MTDTLHVAPKTAQVSPEVQAIHRRLKRRRQLSRALTYLVGILISLWVLIPILFIASMALTTPAEVRAYPKGVLPFIPLSTDTMSFFLSSTRRGCFQAADGSRRTAVGRCCGAPTPMSNAGLPAVRSST